MRNDWHGLLKIFEIWKTDSEGNVVWRDQNLYNLLHLDGEEFLLKACFIGGIENTIIPEKYYFGLDNRTSVASDDTMASIAESGNEPATNGYSRVNISSSNVFNVSPSGDHFVALGPIISFSATGGSWGPTRNLFLTTEPDNTGYLISSVALSEVLTVNTGETINMRHGLALADCS